MVTICESPRSERKVINCTCQNGSELLIKIQVNFFIFFYSLGPRVKKTLFRDFLYFFSSLKAVSVKLEKNFEMYIFLWSANKEIGFR